jgi:hypothetical protein
LNKYDFVYKLSKDIDFVFESFGILNFAFWYNFDGSAVLGPFEQGFNNTAIGS